MTKKVEPLPRVGIGIKETAQILGSSETTVYRHVKSKKLPALKIGGKWLIPLRALERMLALPKDHPAHVP